MVRVPFANMEDGLQTANTTQKEVIFGGKIMKMFIGAVLGTIASLFWFCLGGATVGMIAIGFSEKKEEKVKPDYSSYSRFRGDIQRRPYESVDV